MAPVVTWLGQSGLLVEAGRRRILIDPFFSEHEDRLYPPLSVDEFGSRIDWVLITHEHLDHLDPDSLRAVADRSPGVTVIAPRPLEDRVPRALLVDRGDRIDLPGAGTVTVVPAVHAVEVADGYSDDPRFVGFVLELEGVSLYHSGDTIVSDSVRAALDSLDVDVALLPVNGRTYYREAAGLVGNLDARDAVALATEIGARVLVPIHWDLFDGNTEWPGRAADVAAEADAPLHVLILRRGVPWAL